MNEVLLTVIIPAFNSEQYIERSVKSILNQHVYNVECIVIDDGSTDNTGTKVQQLMDIDTRVKLIRQDNHGVSYARNEGIQRAKGKYITFVDSDDWVLPEAYTCLTKVGNLSGPDIICYGMKRVNNYGEEEHIPFHQCEINKQFIKYSTYMHSVCNKIFRADLLRGCDISFANDVEICEDMLFSFKAIVNAKEIVYLDEDYYCYFTNNESVSYVKTSNNHLMSYKKVAIYIHQIVSELGIETNFSRLIQYREMYYLVFYLTNLSFFSPMKYREENTKRLVWTYNGRIDLFIVTFLANLHIDLFAHIYIGLKRIKNKRGENKCKIIY